MAYQQEISLAQPPSLVQQVAQLIRRFSRQEKAHLLKLVPELQAIPVDEAPTEPISDKQHELTAYFQQKFDAHPVAQPVQSQAHFLGGLTIDEFFLLDEAEQAHLWDTAHAKATTKLENYEHSVREDAIPA